MLTHANQKKAKVAIIIIRQGRIQSKRKKSGIGKGLCNNKRTNSLRKLRILNVYAPNSKVSNYVSLKTTKRNR